MSRPAFELTEENRADVVAVCRQLDGLPLALELAAANSRMLSPHALLSRIDTRLGAGLTAADRPERQRTLGAAIAWSYDLLEHTERAVFRRLGVFRASCDLDAVAAVAGEAGVETLDVVRRLVSTSLVRVDEGVDGEPRVALLETIRAFALERLAESGEADQVRLRHLRWCIDVTGRMSTLLRGPLHTIGLDGINAVENDVRAALDWSLRPAAADADGHERVEAGAALLNLVTTYWYRFGNVAGTEARRWQERGIAVADDVDSEANVTLLHGLGVAVLQQTDVEAAADLFTRQLEMAQRLGHHGFEARAYNDLAIARRQGGDSAESMRLLQQCLRVARENGSIDHEAAALGNVIVVNIDLGRYADAARAAEEAIAADTARGDAWGVALDRLNYMGAILKAEGPQAAHARYTEWAEEIFSFRDKDLTVELMEIGACLVAGLGEPILAARLIAGAEAQRASLEMPRSIAEEALLHEWLDPVRESVPADEWRAACAEGAELSPEHAIELVVSVGAHDRA